MFGTVAADAAPSSGRTVCCYLNGRVGTPSDIVGAVQDAGIDMFDCVMPTRAGRNGVA